MVLAFALAEVARRKRRTASVVIIYMLTVALLVCMQSVSSQIGEGVRLALNPISQVDRDLYVSEAAPASGPGKVPSDSTTALAIEQEASTSNAVLDIAKAGKPGQHFTQDIFLPPTVPTSDQGATQDLIAIPGVVAVTAALTEVAVRRTGTVPTILATYTVPAATIALRPPTAAEEALINQCLQKFIASLPPPTGPPPPKGTTGQAVPIPFTPAYFDCLPPGMREVAIEQQVIHQFLDPPETDFTVSRFSVAGIDVNKPGIGLLVPADIVSGRLMSSNDEVVLEEAYASELHFAVGSTYLLRGKSYRVVGVARPVLTGLAADVYMSLSELQTVSDRSGRVNVFTVRVSTVQDLGRVKASIVSLMPGSQVEASSDLAGQIQGSLASAADAARNARSIVFFLIFTGAVTLVIAATSSTLSRRRREFAILRNLGWTARMILSQLAIEELWLGALGACAGLTLGFVLMFPIAGLTPSLNLAVVPCGFGEQLCRPLIMQTLHISAVLDWSGIAIGISGTLAGMIAAITLGALRVSVAPPAATLARP